MLSKMSTKRKLTPTEQRLFDRVLADRYTHCLREINERGLEGCAQWAIDQAQVLINARRRHLNNSEQAA